MTNTTANISKTLEVCLAPDLLNAYQLESKTVVVIDIFRASSAICTALAYGVAEIIPIDTLEEAHELKEKGFIVAAERKGEVVNGFDFGNSPFSFMQDRIKGKSVALSTSNCTHAIHRALPAKQLIIGSFLNLSAVASHLINHADQIVLLCAGWNNNVNLEDTVFAGALVDRLSDHFHISCDAAMVAQGIYQLAKKDLKGFLKQSSHSHRLEHLHLQKDIDFCLQIDETMVIPILKGKSLVAFS